MNLTKENLQEWKTELDKEMLRRFEIKNFSGTCDDEYWLEKYLGEEVDEPITDEIDAWND